MPRSTRSKKPAPRKAPPSVELPSRGGKQPVLGWVLRLLFHSSAYRRLPSYSDDLDAVLETIGIKHEQGDKPSPQVVGKHVAAKLREKPAAPSDEEEALVRRNAAMLGDLLGLGAEEREVLTFVALSGRRAAISACMRAIEPSSPRVLASLLSNVLGTDLDATRRALDVRGALRSLGLLQLHRTPHSDESPLSLLDGLDGHLFEPHDDVASLLSTFVRVAPDARQRVADYPHLAADVDLVVRLIRVALDRGLVGVNVLLHGPSGTGKTELSRAIACALGAAVYDVQVESRDHEVLSANARLSAFQLCQRLARRGKPAVVVFDEIEDVFRLTLDLFREEGLATGRNKGFINRLLEENTAPAIWISNRIDQIDPAVLRRFDVVLEVPAPPERVRRSILDRYLEGLDVKPDWVTHMAQDEALTPAHTERAVRVARLVEAKGDAETTAVLDRLLRASLALTRSTQPPSTRRSALGYDLSLVRTDTDLAALVESLRTRRAATLCLYGPPGTGKTAFAWHLAKRLELPLVTRRASEILGAYVGQTEANLAEMFRRATIDRAVLFLDEADSFLQRRETADRQWEITQVNELLTQMDTFDGVFLCATNRIDSLDPASLRRFDVRVKLDYLDRAQRLTLFGRALAELCIDIHTTPGGDPALGGLDRLHNLTPGDFTTVVRRGKLLNDIRTPQALLAALEAEARAKGDGSRVPLGFSS